MRRVATILASVCFVGWGITFDAAPFEQGAPFRIEAGGSAPGDRVLAVPLTIRMDGSQRRCPLWTIRALAGSPRNGVWQQLAAAAAQGQETATLRVSSGSRVVLLVTCSGEEGYSLHGPISWPARAASLVVHPRRRRTVRVDRGDRRLRVRLVVPGQPEPSRWPRCVEDSATHVSCIGVPFELSALAVAGHRGDLGWGVAAPDSTTVQEVVLQTGQWGRLVRLVVPRSVGERDLVVTPLREPLSRSGWFHARVRLRRDEQTAVLPVGRHVLWVVGTGDTTERLLEFSGPSVTTRRLAISMLVEGDSVQALDIYLRPSTPVNGVTTDATGTPVGGTVVAVFELVDAVGQTDRNERPPQRRWLAETVSGPDGRFSFSGLDREEYEFLAAHPRHGRAVERVRPDGRSLSLRLQPTPRLQGRVFVAGQVAEGVAVRVVPDQDQLLAAGDPLELVAPDARTDRHGRFDLALPRRGRGELIVGGDGLAKVRQRYRAAESLPPVTDVGDVVLPSPVEVLVRLFAPGCELHAVGPIGVLGMDIVRAVYDVRRAAFLFRLPESGFWWIEATCGGETRGVLPPVARVEAGVLVQTIEATLAP